MLLNIVDKMGTGFFKIVLKQKNISCYYFDAWLFLNIGRYGKPVFSAFAIYYFFAFIYTKQKFTL